MSDEPDPPRGVHAVFADGTRQELPVEYVGRDVNDLHVWRALLRFERPGRVERFAADYVPAWTLLTVVIAEPHAQIDLG